MLEQQMTIAGRAETAANTLAVINPATATEFARVPDCSREQLDAAMASASDAFITWRSDEVPRRRALKASAERIREKAGELARLLTLEQGKPLAAATEEIMGSAAWLDYTSTLDIPVEVVQDDATARVEVHRRPLGVVAAITPWNFPVLLAVWKLAPALLAGNTVVLKPSPFTPVTTLALGEALRDVLPTGVFNVVSGGNELGAWMTSHPAVRKISFTGSTATGKHVAASAAADLKRVTLELGGNDAAIVLDDVDPEATAEKLFWSAFANCGQICSAVKRAYVPKDMHTRIASRMAEIASSVKVGDGFEEGVLIGPLNNRPQFDRVGELVADARRSGAKVLAGGEPVGGAGYFFKPTILTGVEEGTRIVDEEQFGPALPVMPYSDVEEAIERANRSSFGLSGSVWGADTDRGASVASRLECGTAWVNQHLAIVPHLPFGGFKHSGIGVENGPWGLMGFTQIQTLNVARQ